MKKIVQSFLVSILFYSNSSAFSQTQKDKLVFYSKRIGEIRIQNDSIFVNNKNFYHFDEPSIDYSNKLNRFIENSHSIFLFLVIYGSPNKDRLYGFKITNNKVDSVADAIASGIKDFDNDGYLEFGGSDLTEEYTSKDSMYYIPTTYYEIRNGKILFDSLLTKQKDIELNGVYLKNPLDRNGYCCKVIPKSDKKVNVYRNQ